MQYYVYVIESDVDGSFYKGYSEDPSRRLLQHNAGETQSTCHLIPWKLVYVEAMDSKRSAVIREKNLKKATRERIIALLNHPKNICKEFING